MADNSLKRIGTGISGLDNVLKGGIPEKNQIIVEGAPGTGKSSIAFSIVYNSAKQGIPSAFISLDERAENVIKNAKTILGEDNQIDELIKKGMLVIDGEDFAAKISTNTEPENSYSTANLVS
ncbi:MAG: ATPase domain-containing protein, partial [Candidatus Micrarchaeaceae archaeon]